MAKTIQAQINSLLTGEGRYLSVHDQWELAQSLKKLNVVKDALIAERSMLGKGQDNYLPLFDKTQAALKAITDYDVEALEQT